MTYISGVVEGFYGRPWTNEQRKHLFSLLRKFGMNTYLYAPKDDLKHRAEWRLLYTAEETALLESLIKTANENGITFVYALSPGIDIVYSSSKEIKAIQDKLTQVRSLGCSAFSLLFDDIETKMNEMDRKQFSSFSLAQLTVANSVYELMDSPLFFFCPTEYCESCSVPNLNESEYLSLLGSKLHPDIHILWTGPRVVSRLLTVEHLQRVSNVLRRKPMIWDNLHANDYDPKRIFMGPFMGRSVAIKNETSGLLLNPNCKYEANYIPLFTLSDWVQADLDAPKVEEERGPGINSFRRGRKGGGKKQKCSSLSSTLRRALDNWLPQFGQGPGPNIPPLSQLETQAIAPVIEPNAVSSAEIPPPTIRTCEGNEMLSDLPPPIYTSPIGHATTVCVQAFPLSEAIIGVVEAHDCSAISKTPQTVNSLTTDYNEPMEIPAGVCSKVSLEETSKTLRKKKNRKIFETMQKKTTTTTSIPMDLDVDSSSRRTTTTQQSSSMDSIKNINMENVALFVDIFYLPFEHGKHGVTLLNELKWLYENAKIIKIDEKNGKESEEWHRRFKGFQRTNNQLTELYQNVIKSPNKSLLQEIFPYLWEAQGLISVLCALLEWIECGNLLLSPGDSTIWSADEVDPDSLEPWALGGGLLPDLQKLIVSSPKLGEIFTVKFAIPLSLRCYKIRPVDLHQIDKAILFELFASTNERKLSAEFSHCHSPEQIFFDRTFAPFLKYGIPAHHFIAESAGDSEENDGNGNHYPCSLALGILNFAGILDDLNEEFLPLFKSKYSQRPKNQQTEEMEEDDDGNGQKQEIDGEICRRLEAALCLPKEFYSIYQSLIEIRWPTDVNEAVSVRRLLHCVSASLSLNGSTGFFTIIESDQEAKLELLTRLGLDIIEHSSLDSDDNNSELMNGFTIMGHTL